MIIPNIWEKMFQTTNQILYKRNWRFQTIQVTARPLSKGSKAHGCTNLRGDAVGPHPCSQVDASIDFPIPPGWAPALNKVENIGNHRDQLPQSDTNLGDFQIQELIDASTRHIWIPVVQPKIAGIKGFQSGQSRSTKLHDTKLRPNDDVFVVLRVLKGLA